MTEAFSDPRPPHDEPEEGWVEAPTLLTEPLAMMLLCRYSGLHQTKIEGTDDRECLIRKQGLHADEDCLELYYSAELVKQVLSNQAGRFPTEFVAELRMSWGDPTYTDPLT